MTGRKGSVMGKRKRKKKVETAGRPNFLKVCDAIIVTISALVGLVRDLWMSVPKGQREAEQPVEVGFRPEGVSLDGQASRDGRAWPVA
jgi:hypothetical protein